MPSVRPCIAPATVPETVTSSAMFWPRLTPDRIRSGSLPVTMSCTPISTQSDGVPVTANQRSSTSRTRSGMFKVSARLMPDCSSAGATTQTSAEIEHAISCSTFRPGARTPSSLVIRMRGLSPRKELMTRSAPQARPYRGAAPGVWQSSRPRSGGFPECRPWPGRPRRRSRSACAGIPASSRPPA